MTCHLTQEIGRKNTLCRSQVEWDKDGEDDEQLLGKTCPYAFKIVNFICLQLA